MKLDSIYKKTKTGLAVEFRSASPADAQIMIDYLKKVCGETRFLLSEAEDVNYTLDGEKTYLENYENSERGLMLNAYVDGKLAGNASFDAVNPAKRLSHRASMGIAVFSEYWGQGIGEELIEILIEKAGQCGYEILELDVFAKNARARHLYEKLGFEERGCLKSAVKYADGSYDDLVLMQLAL